MQVGDTTYTGKHVVLATGSAPKTLPGLEVDGSRVISSDHALKLDRVPASVVILGGGVIGVEFASVWQSFGAEVTDRRGAAAPACRWRTRPAPSCWSGRSAAAGSSTSSAPASPGVEHTDHGRPASRWRAARPSRPSCCWSPSAAARSRRTSATRRSASPIDRGFVKVDAYCQTNVPTISAVGDLIPTPQLAHVGFGEGILVAERLAGLPVVPIDYDGVPRVTYSEPEVASVGLTEAQAVEKYGADAGQDAHLRPGRQRQEPDPARPPARSSWSRRRTARCVGVHMVGSRVGELLAEAQLIYNWEALPSEVAQLIHAHPTQSEAVGEAHLALAGKPLHVHG